MGYNSYMNQERISYNESNFIDSAFMDAGTVCSDGTVNQNTGLN